MTETMLAERFHAADRSITLEDIPIPHPGPGEVLIKVAYCGICHSDLSLISGAFPASRPAVTQGHEASGTIVELGAGVTGWKEGDRVIPSAGRPCLKCRKCRRGAFTDCLSLNLMAFAYDGAWAEYHVAQASGMTKIPDNVPMDQAALLADAVSTPYAAVVRTGKVHMGNAVAVWGVGGVGTHLVQLAKLAGGVPVIAIDLNDAVLERAKRLGADHTLRSDDPELMQKIEDITNGRMIDVAFDAVGIKPTLRACVDSLDVDGKAVSVGLSSRTSTPARSWTSTCTASRFSATSVTSARTSPCWPRCCRPTASTSRSRSPRSFRCRRSRAALRSWSPIRATRSVSSSSPDAVQS